MKINMTTTAPICTGYRHKIYNEMTPYYEHKKLSLVVEYFKEYV